MTLETPFEIRDSVHGLIRLTEQEMRIVDTRAFQRLRRIRQLAMADLVYPGALHTRFEHSLGVLHVTQLILRSIEKSERVSDNNVKVIRLAALLHDVGHGPFSHVSEELLDRFYDRSQGVVPPKERIHEKLTLDIIRWSDISECLDSGQMEEVIEIIGSSGRNDYRRHIISSSIDADKMDYLLRDSYYTGAKYGTFDLDKVIEELSVYRPPGSSDESFLVIDEHGRFALEQMFVAKYHMTQQVYSHRVRTITDAMIVRALVLAIEGGSEEVARLFSHDGTEEFVRRYLRYDDSALALAVFEGSEHRSKSIFRRLGERRLFKEISLRPMDDKNEQDSFRLMRLKGLTQNKQAVKRLESRLAQHLGCNEWEVIVLPKPLKNPLYAIPVDDPDSVQVRTKQGLRSFNSFDDLLLAKFPSTERIHIIGPVEESDGRGSKKREDLRREVESVTNDFVQKGYH